MTHILALGQYAQSHLLGIALAILISYIIGSLWHGPLFGKQWIALNNLKPPAKEDMKFSMMLPGLTANFVMITVQSIVLGRTFQMLNLTNVGDALIITTVLWLPFSALLLTNIYAWGGKPFKLTVLDSTHALVCMWAISAVLFVTL